MFSKVLFNANSIPVVPEIAEIYGPKEAMFLQQIHYWIQHKMNNPQEYERSTIGGHYWFYGTFKNLADKYPVFGCERTIRRMVSRLVKEKVLIAFKPYKDEGDHTYWYRIDDDLLFEKYEQRRQENLQKRVQKQRKSSIPASDKMSERMDKVSNTSDNLSMASDKMSEPSDNLSDSYTKTSTKTSSESGPRKREQPSPETDPLFDDFWEPYPKKVKKKKCRQIFSRLTLEQKEMAIKDLRKGRGHLDKRWLNKNGEPEFAPNPETYLNNEQWEDEWVSKQDIFSDSSVFDSVDTDPGTVTINVAAEPVDTVDESGAGLPRKNGVPSIFEGLPGIDPNMFGGAM